MGNVDAATVGKIFGPITQTLHSRLCQQKFLASVHEGGVTEAAGMVEEHPRMLPVAADRDQAKLAREFVRMRFQFPAVQLIPP